MTLTRIGRYEVEKELGRGAMAIVYKATDPLIGRVVAIKTIRLEHSLGIEQDELRQRLYREAQSAGGMNHPSIVTIYDIGHEGDVAYIAMEFVDGQTLEAWMAQNPMPPLEQTLAIITQVAEGLDYAASRGIIHRDIKPGNILVTSDLKAKIADFGIAKMSMAKFTQTGMIMGTPSYMSPEQAMGKDLDGRSDLFSLGVIFYEMLTGERPFTGTNPTTIIYKILHEEPVSPRKLNVTLHAGLDFIVRRMLQKDPAERYQSCAELIRDLGNYQSLPPGPADAPAPQPPPIAPRQSRLLPVMGGLVVVAALAAGVYFYLQTQPAPVMPPPAARQGSSQDRAPADKAAVRETARIQKESQLTEAQAAATVSGSAIPEQAAPAAMARKDAPAIGTAPPKEPAPAKIAPAIVTLNFAGAPYKAALYEGQRKLHEFSASGSVEVSAGPHQFRIVSEEVFLDRPLKRVRLNPEQAFEIMLPGLGSVYIGMPNDAYDGCQIWLNGQLLPTPYPAQLPKLAGGVHRVVFRWNAGKYAGKEVSSVITTQEGHHYLVTVNPESGTVDVQQAR